MNDEHPYPRIGIAGGGTIATGLAAVASVDSDVVMLARSEESAAKAEERARKTCSRTEGADPDRITHSTDELEMARCGLVVESIVENPEAKVELLSRVAAACPHADLATTTSSLSVAALGERCGAPERFFALHVFNPVPRLDLVELCFPPSVSEQTRQRARHWCEAVGKTGVEVPDQRGFVVNRLLFPFLFHAVRLWSETQMPAADVDACMTLGASHPLGPLALLDFVGLDVAVAIGDHLYEDTANPAHRAPGKLRELVESGRLGRKSGAGIFDYA